MGNLELIRPAFVIIGSCLKEFDNQLTHQLKHGTYIKLYPDLRFELFTAFEVQLKNHLEIEIR